MAAMSKMAFIPLNKANGYQNDTCGTFSNFYKTPYKKDRVRSSNQWDDTDKPGLISYPA